MQVLFRFDAFKSVRVAVQELALQRERPRHSTVDRSYAILMGELGPLLAVGVRSKLYISTGKRVS